MAWGTSGWLENIDAAIFSGDALEDEQTRADIKEHAERWLRAVAAHEKMLAEEQPK